MEFIDAVVVLGVWGVMCFLLITMTDSFKQWIYCCLFVGLLCGFIVLGKILNQPVLAIIPAALPVFIMVFGAICAGSARWTSCGPAPLCFKTGEERHVGCDKCILINKERDLTIKELFELTGGQEKLDHWCKVCHVLKTKPKIHDLSNITMDDVYGG